MSVIPVSRLSSSDLAILGNNVGCGGRRRPGRAARSRRLVRAAVNRSLAAVVGESVRVLHTSAPMHA